MWEGIKAMFNSFLGSPLSVGSQFLQLGVIAGAWAILGNIMKALQNNLSSLFFGALFGA